jgi:integration host factor subunit alpha
LRAHKRANFPLRAKYSKIGFKERNETGRASKVGGGSERRPEGDDNRKTTTRADLLNAVYASCPSLSRAKAKQIFEMALEEIANALVSGEPVKLRSFGLFLVRTKRERIGRNPRTGVEVPITPRRVLTFKPSPVLSAAVNSESTREEGKRAGQS